MSDHGSEAGGEEIIRKILGDGKARADRVRDNARRTVEAEKRKAEAEADRVSKGILDEAARKAAALKSKEVAGAHVEAKRILLRAREQAIAGVFETVREALDKVRGDTPRYRSGLLNLAVEAVRAIGLPRVNLVLGKEDEALAGPDFAEEVTRRTSSEGPEATHVEIMIDHLVTGGGCMARSEDGRVVFDNTFSRRLERLRPLLRSTIVSEVFKNDA
jgi:vacuolar-type H+-ATPase subunit E/Vma4